MRLIASEESLPRESMVTFSILDVRSGSEGPRKRAMKKMAATRKRNRLIESQRARWHNNVNCLCRTCVRSPNAVAFSSK